MQWSMQTTMTPVTQLRGCRMTRAGCTLLYLQCVFFTRELISTPDIVLRIACARMSTFRRLTGCALNAHVHTPMFLLFTATDDTLYTG